MALTQPHLTADQICPKGKRPELYASCCLRPSEQGQAPQPRGTLEGVECFHRFPQSAVVADMTLDGRGPHQAHTIGAGTATPQELPVVRYKHLEMREAHWLGLNSGVEMESILQHPDDVPSKRILLLQWQNTLSTILRSREKVGLRR